MTEKTMPEWGETVHVDGREYVVTAVGTIHIYLRDKSDDSLVITLPEIDEYKTRAIQIGDTE